MTSRSFGPYSLLLAALVFFCALLPFVVQFGVGGDFVKGGFTVVLLAGVLVARGNRAVLGVGLVLIVANLLAQWLVDSVWEGVVDPKLVRPILSAVYIAYLIGLLLRDLVGQRSASADTVLGGINVYVLLALVFMELHLVVEGFDPGSYVKGGEALSLSLNHETGDYFSTMFYFSIV